MCFNNSQAAACRTPGGVSVKTLRGLEVFEDFSAFQGQIDAHEVFERHFFAATRLRTLNRYLAVENRVLVVFLQATSVERVVTLRLQRLLHERSLDIFEDLKAQGAFRRFRDPGKSHLGIESLLLLGDWDNRFLFYASVLLIGLVECGQYRLLSFADVNGVNVGPAGWLQQAV